MRGFDVLCDDLGAEKIKTIGDCYMAVAGIDGDGPGGARAVGRLALAMLESMGRCASLGGERLRLRVGLHTGPATAGVIGDTFVAVLPGSPAACELALGRLLVPQLGHIAALLRPADRS